MRLLIDDVVYYSARLVFSVIALAAVAGFLGLLVGALLAVWLLIALVGVLIPGSVVVGFWALFFFAYLPHKRKSNASAIASSSSVKTLTRPSASR